MVEAAKAKQPVKQAKKAVAKATKAVKKAAPKAKAVAKKATGSGASFWYGPDRPGFLGARALPLLPLFHSLLHRLRSRARRNDCAKDLSSWSLFYVPGLILSSGCAPVQAPSPRPPPT